MVNNSLTGKCLVAMPSISDELFAHTVIYVCDHNNDGAMGLVVNKQIREFYFSDLISQFNIAKIEPIEPIMLHQGGPIDKIRGFVLHSAEYNKDDTKLIDDKIAISSSLSVLNDIAFGIGPRYNLIALGYSSWNSKQLEKEIINNDWLVVEPTPELLFKCRDEDKWQQAIDSLDFDISRIAYRGGRA